MGCASGVRQAEAQDLSQRGREVAGSAGLFRLAGLEGRAPEEQRHVSVVLVLGAVAGAALGVPMHEHRSPRHQEGVVQALGVEVIQGERDGGAVLLPALPLRDQQHVHDFFPIEAPDGLRKDASRFARVTVPPASPQGPATV